MNRMEEYHALLQELEETPARLNYTVVRAKARARRQKRNRFVTMPLTSLAALCVCFVLLVNVSAPFARACADIPVLKGLAAAVRFDRSLSAAVENEWVQPIGLTERNGGMAMTVEYVIVDQKQLNIFYTLKGGAETDPEDRYMVRSDLRNAAGEDLPFSLVTGSSGADGELYRITADFTSAEDFMPGQVRLECDLRLIWDESESEEREETVGSFAFDLSFDPQFTAQATVVELDRWLELDGQRIMLKSVEIYPTHMRLNLADDPDNTAWLRGLEFYAEDEDGNRYERGSNGIVSTGSPDTPFTQSFRLESSFFSDSEGLSLYITGAGWLEKDQRWITVDTNAPGTVCLPNGASLESVERSGAALTVKTMGPDGADTHAGQMILGWKAPDGTQGYIDEWSDYSYDGNHYETYVIRNYTWDTIELELNYSKTTEYAEPVVIDLS